ncbi:30S ribosomal protein S20 [Candidatus Acetothermia bacterium]|nr:30S ribosomal protein S20 [Candidatus Acetothermia bacterium]MBI3461169.1 30S ribosomal protein S20 [Candidatus Acetothermia bacterium]MBI3660365.1 30S ribosomal protein S20 [Candidatus Acetothermia bacterium]
MRIPNIKAAAKALRQNEKRRARNLKRKEGLKKIVKEMKRHLAAGDAAKARELAPQLMQATDKAVAKGTIHRNKAARIKSRLLSQLAGSGAPIAKPAKSAAR